MFCLISPCEEAEKVLKEKSYNGEGLTSRGGRQPSSGNLLYRDGLIDSLKDCLRNRFPTTKRQVVEASLISSLKNWPLPEDSKAISG